MANVIHLRIDQIHAFETVEMLIQFDVGRCHQLIEYRKDQYAMDLIHPYRLIFERQKERIKVIRIIDIADYH
jgi:proteic killer suppression protein